MSPITASSGWAWLKQGAGMFRKQPAGLTTLLFANILISILVNFIPLVGPILAAVMIPCFSMAFMQACLLIDRGNRVTPDVLLTGFRPPAVKTLMKVGLVYLAVFALLGLFVYLSVSDEFWKQGQKGADPTQLPHFQSSDVLVFLGVSFVQAITVLTLAFTAPLTYWQKMETGKAVFYSFFAVVRAGRAFIVLLVSWFGILLGLCIVILLLFGNSVPARIIVMWVSFVFLLLLQCALYAAYRQIFGTPASEPVSLTKA